MGSFFLPPSTFLVLSSGRGAKVQRIAKRPFHFRCKIHASEGDANGGEGFLSKSRKESQSDHFIFLATKNELFDSQVPGLPSTTHGSRILPKPPKLRGSQGCGMQGMCRVYHLQTNIEPWSEGVEPRKRNVVIGFYPQMR